MKMPKNTYTPVFNGIKKVAVKCFFAGEVHELVENEKYKLGESQNFTQGFVHHLIKSSISTVVAAHFVEQ